MENEINYWYASPGRRTANAFKYLWVALSSCRFSNITDSHEISKRFKIMHCMRTLNDTRPISLLSIWTGNSMTWCQINGHTNILTLPFTLLHVYVYRCLNDKLLRSMRWIVIVVVVVFFLFGNLIETTVSQVVRCCSVKCIYYYYIVCRLLGFRRAFPVTGRSINLTSEIFNICTNELRSTFFTSLQPYNNLCLTGTCRRYCDIYHPVCGQNGLIEVSAFRHFSLPHNPQRYIRQNKNKKQNKKNNNNNRTNHDTRGNWNGLSICPF